MALQLFRFSLTFFFVVRNALSVSVAVLGVLGGNGCFHTLGFVGFQLLSCEISEFRLKQLGEAELTRQSARAAEAAFGSAFHRCSFHAVGAGFPGPCRTDGSRIRRNIVQICDMVPPGDRKGRPYK
jgi:hypothetical protein